jgi:4-hydroxybenzoate polyprenyltransferase
MAEKQESFHKQPFKFISKWRSIPPYEMISYLLMYTSIPLLAFGVQSFDITLLWIILLAILTLYSGFFAALIWNDITDADIDSKVHPDRPIPSGRISKERFFRIALVFSVLVVVFASLLSLWCLLVVCCAAIFVALHDKYLKRIVKIPAYSEIFTPIQWIVVAVFGYVAIWSFLPQSTEVLIDLPILGPLKTGSYEFYNMLLLVLFTYFADDAHDLPEGICDAEGDRKLGVRTYATSFGEKNAARISFAMFFLSGILGFLLFYRTDLTYIFLIPFIINWVYIMKYSYILLTKKDDEIKSFSAIVGRKGFNYLLISFNLMFIDMFIQLIVYNTGIF